MWRREKWAVVSLSLKILTPCTCNSKKNCKHSSMQPPIMQESKLAMLLELTSQFHFLFTHLRLKKKMTKPRKCHFQIQTCSLSCKDLNT